MLVEASNRYNKISEAITGSERDGDLLTALENFIEIYKTEKNKKENLTIPLTLFNQRKLGILETAIKFLKESTQMSYSDIAKILKRDDRTIWASYSSAKKKHKEFFSLNNNEEYFVPCNIFSNRELGPLEALTIYAHEDLKFQFSKISKLLNRNYRTIWLSYRNGIKKRGLINEQQRKAA